MLTLRFGLACTLVTAVAWSDTQRPACDNQGMTKPDAATDGNLLDSGTKPDVGEGASDSRGNGRVHRAGSAVR